MTTDKSKNFFRVSAEDFKKIPGSPIAYWASARTAAIFSKEAISKSIDIRAGVLSGNDNLFVKNWFEVSFQDIPLTLTSHDEMMRYNPKWLPITGGGGYRKWYGALFSIINSQNNFSVIKNKEGNNYRLREPKFYFKRGLNWPLISSRDFCAKLSPENIVFGNSVRSAFLLSHKNGSIDFFIGLLCSKIVGSILKFVNPTVNFNNEDIAIIPVCNSKADAIVENNSLQNISTSKKDWDSYETSWDFQMNPLLAEYNSGKWVKQTPIWSIYDSVRRKWAEDCEKMRQLEMSNNRIFIDAYGLQDELTSDVPWDEITLTCNPWYRYGKSLDHTKTITTQDAAGEIQIIDGVSSFCSCTSDGIKTDMPYLAYSGNFPYSQELEERLLEDTIKEFISYAVGCMMGRYSLALPGLVIANQGESLVEFLEIHNEKLRWNISQCSSDDLHDMYQKAVDVCGFIPDEDGVLPILDEEWFLDDIVTQFKNFVAFVFGKENLVTNMDFIEAVLGKDIRKYFVKDFYKEHIQRYKKRPIYWLFSSPKGSFNALIYLHRYTPDTVSIVLNEYLRELMTKISTRIKHLIEENNRADISNSDKARNLKQIDKYTAQLAELEDYERDIIFPLAQQKIAIDLDDGVKVNYCKFGAALKKIPGLEAKEE